MIPSAYLTEWSLRVPWALPIQVEQDLILSRMMLEIAEHRGLGGELAMRGGTCLHKLFLDEPLRYSQDLDYVRSTHSGIGPYLDALRQVALDIGLEERGRELGREQVQIWFSTVPTVGLGTIRIKVEMNVRETVPWRPHSHRPHAVESRWWSGKGSVRTYELEELLGTKLRALYQRRKGRDLFDLWVGLEILDADPSLIVEAFRHYVPQTAISPHFRREAPAFRHGDERRNGGLHLDC